MGDTGGFLGNFVPSTTPPLPLLCWVPCVCLEGEALQGRDLLPPHPKASGAVLAARGTTVSVIANPLHTLCPNGRLHYRECRHSLGTIIRVVEAQPAKVSLPCPSLCAKPLHSFRKANRPTTGLGLLERCPTRTHTKVVGSASMPGLSRAGPLGSEQAGSEGGVLRLLHYTLNSK